MRRWGVRTIPAGLAIVLIWFSPCLALNAWKISDFSGEVSFMHGNERVAASIGGLIASQDTLSIGQGAWVEVVSAGTCEVWELKGAGQYSFGEHDTITGPDRNKVSPDQRLSVCFDPGGFSTGRAERIGGIIERGGSPEEELAEIGSKSNAALINLIILNALQQKDIERARPYYEALKNRSPNSGFVASVAEMFEGKTPHKP
jgi:hypothetical protein